MGRIGSLLLVCLAVCLATASAPAFGQSSGTAPILVIETSSNPFTKYYEEILRAEGFNAFDVLDISKVSATVLASYDVAILGETALNSSQVSMFTTWVNSGGNLIAMRPDKQTGDASRADDNGLDARERLPADRHVEKSRRRVGQPDDPVPRHRRPVHGERQHRHCDACTRARCRPRLLPRSRCAMSARGGRPPPSPTTSPARSSTRGRATPRGPARNATARRRFVPTTCSTAPPRRIRSPTGSTSTRSPSLRPTSSSGCWPT